MARCQRAKVCRRPSVKTMLCGDALRVTPKNDWIIARSHYRDGRKPVIGEPKSRGNGGKKRVESGPILVQFEKVTVLKVEFNVTAVFSETIELRAGDHVDFVPCDSKTASIRVNAPNAVVVGTSALGRRQWPIDSSAQRKVFTTPP